tara:strand:- start:301 stop:471 length:171 start_codon:yes stop_codon:yes gene_type:complete
MNYIYVVTNKNMFGDTTVVAVYDCREAAEDRADSCGEDGRVSAEILYTTCETKEIT